MTATDGWFAAGDPEDEESLVDTIHEDEDRFIESIRDGRAEEPRDWPTLAVDAGFAADEDDYYDALHGVTVAAASAVVAQREGADDRQLVHAVRAMDDCRRTANELAERVAEWGGTLDPDAGTGIEYAGELATREPATRDAVSETDRDAGVHLEPVRSLATHVVALAAEADRLEALLEDRTPAVAPNLAALAGPVLAARLISLAGGLESLAKKPSGTIQVLGAEDALFAHLRGHAPSPKHGVIYTHEAIQTTHPDDRGSAARALAGKLAIAARIDHYSGEPRPELEVELRERIETIQSRTTEGDGSEGTNGGER